MQASTPSAWRSSASLFVYSRQRLPGLLAGRFHGVGRRTCAVQTAVADALKQSFVIEGGTRLSGTRPRRREQERALPILAALPAHRPSPSSSRTSRGSATSRRCSRCSARRRRRRRLDRAERGARPRGRDRDDRARRGALPRDPRLDPARRAAARALRPGGRAAAGRRRDRPAAASTPISTRSPRSAPRSTIGRSYELRGRRLAGADIFLDEASVTGTENAVMAAVARRRARR